MPQPRLLRIYLDKPSLTLHRAGKYYFFSRLTQALERVGWRVEARVASDQERLKAPSRRGYALYRMQEPTHERALTARRSYIGAFWHIERTGLRWLWPVAQAAFPDTGEAPGWFATNWRRKMTGAARVPEGGGGVLIPLQGILERQRSFQAASPLEMIAQTLARLPGQAVTATLHPEEDYSPSEIAALDDLARQHDRFTWQRGGTSELLTGCDLVVTQNSAVALNGFFLHKPAVLFGEVDFHHIAGSVPRMGLDAAFEHALGPPPDFDRYVWWFLRENAINAAAEDGEAQILRALAAHGWPVDA